ncbi:hypothetical protein ACX818_001323 [Acinetobacter baumannii]
MILKLISLAALLALLSQSALASNDRDFNKFVEGALVVYSQFKTPSKEESEKFYDFIQSKWNHSECNKNCSQVGYAVGKQYAKEKNIEIKTKK